MSLPSIDGSLVRVIADAPSSPDRERQATRSTPPSTVDSRRNPSVRIPMRTWAAALQPPQARLWIQGSGAAVGGSGAQARHLRTPAA